jgi:transposase
MRKGRPKVALILTDDERRRLDSLAHRSRTAPHVARRARIILACADGSDSKVVARRLQVTPGTVCKWRSRFITQRLDGLYDEPRPGAKRTITDEQVEQVIVRTLETTPRGATHWSTREMAKAVGLSHMAISRIWHTFGLQPHRTETFKLSNDPLLVEKVRDIVGLYLDPPAHARCFASMRSRKFKPSIGRRRCCRCNRDRLSAGHTITSGMARRRCLRRLMRRPAR